MKTLIDRIKMALAPSVVITYLMLLSVLAVHPTPIKLSDVSSATEVTTYQYSQSSALQDGRQNTEAPYESEDVGGIVTDALEAITKDAIRRRQSTPQRKQRRPYHK